MNPHIQLTGAGVKRRELDFYPTPPDVTNALCKFLIDKNIITKKSVIWEPACGDGAMSKVLSDHFENVISTDIRHTGYGTGGVDFLKDICVCDAIITNPPFVFSQQFIRHAIAQTGVVAMILKSQYWHAANRIALFQTHTPAYVLALTWRPDFLFDQRHDGKRAAPTMECIVTIWVQGDTDTKYALLTQG